MSIQNTLEEEMMATAHLDAAHRGDIVGPLAPCASMTQLLAAPGWRACSRCLPSLAPASS